MFDDGGPHEESRGLGRSSLLSALDAARTAVAEVAGHAADRAWASGPTDRVRAIEELARVRRIADAAHLALVRSLDDRDAVALGAGSTAALLAWRLNLAPGRARSDVAAARALDPDTGALPALGAALGAGEVSLAHVDVAVRTLDRLPSALRREHAGAVDAFLAQQSRVFRPRECEHLAALVLDRLDPDRADRGFDPEAFARRHLDITADATGMVLVRGQLDPAAGAQLKAAIDHLAAPAPAVDARVAGGTAEGTGAVDARGGDARSGAEDGVDEQGSGGPGHQGTVRVRDGRTAGQRRADALGLLARRGAGAAGTRGGEPPRIVVHATVDQLLGRPGAGRAACEQVGPLDAAALRRLSDDAVLQAVVLAPSGAVLRLGRSVRCFTPAQRRALLARDGGCVIPGCDAPSAWLEGHHVTAWAAGGTTDVDNAVLVCGAHHSAVTVGVWGVRMVAGLPQVRAPLWTDPQRRWLHPPRRAAERAVQHLGHCLVLDTG